ncbi:MAG: SGNH/GDSL hydrolase family protein [Prevotella sp.]|nr:SGNH/GDSL hydrolase family protein [Prevotella sp.]
MRHWIASLSLFVFALHLEAVQPTALHIALLGDSNTWIGGDDCSKARGWNKWFKEVLRPASIRSYARSGATWTHTPATTIDTKENIGTLGDNNVIFNQVKRLIEAEKNGIQTIPDLIIIMAGTNDVWFNDKRPHALESLGQQDCYMADAVDSVSVVLPCWQRLVGAVRQNVGLLRTAFPGARIVLLTPMQTTAAPVDSIAKASQLIEAEGGRLGCDVIRLDGDDCISSKHERQKRTHTSDGTHTNVAGARKIGNYVAGKVLKLIE